MSFQRNRPIQNAYFLKKEEALPQLQLQDYYDIDKEFSKPGFKLPNGKFNWHCSCVASYVTGPCGFFFRQFMQNVDKFLKADDAFEKPENRILFEKVHRELMGCVKTYPDYYKSFINEYKDPEQLAMKGK